MKLQRQLRRAGSEGFSLAELMVVIVIIGLLATVVLPNVFKNLFSARSGTVKASLISIGNAIETYSMDHNGKFPESLEQLIERDANGHAYLSQSEVPKDPWGNPYRYEAKVPGEPRPRVYTYGADGAPGGTGEDADISWQDVIDGKLDED